MSVVAAQVQENANGVAPVHFVPLRKHRKEEEEEEEARSKKQETKTKQKVVSLLEHRRLMS